MCRSGFFVFGCVSDVVWLHILNSHNNELWSDSTLYSAESWTNKNENGKKFGINIVFKREICVGIISGNVNKN